MHLTHAQCIGNSNSPQSWSNQGYPQPIIISSGNSDNGLKSLLPLLLLLLTDNGCGAGCGPGCRCGYCGGCGGGCGGCGCGGCGCCIPIPYPIPYPINCPITK